MSAVTTGIKGVDIGQGRNKSTVYTGTKVTPTTDSSGNKTDKVSRYNSNTNSWSAMTSMNSIREAPATEVVNNKIYAIGGNGTNDSAEIYDINTNQWTNISASSGNFQNRKNAFSGVVDNKMYIIGGQEQPPGGFSSFQYYRIETTESEITEDGHLKGFWCAYLRC